MHIKDGYPNKRVTFNMKDSLQEKIDRCKTMMSKFTALDDGQNKQFKPQIFWSKRRGQTRNFMISTIMTKETIRTCIDQTTEIEEFHLVVEYNVDKIIEIN